MRPGLRTWLVALGAGLVLELAVGAIAAASSLTGWRLDLLGLVALGLITVIGAAWHRRAVPAAGRGAQLLAALPVPLFFAVIGFASVAARHGGVEVGDVVLTVLAIAVGLPVGDRIGRAVAAQGPPSTTGGYR